MKAKETLLIGITILTLIFNLIYGIRLTSILTIAFLIVIVYYYVIKIVKYQEEQNFIKQNLVIAKNMLFDTQKFIIIIVKGKEIVWANDLAYQEFPVILANRKIKTINLDKIDNNEFVFNTSIYQCEIKNGIYIVTNITKEKRETDLLYENKLNIAIFQIDNYSYLKDNLKGARFIEFEAKFKNQLLGWFSKQKISYQSIGEERYQLLFPSSILAENIAKNFNFLSQLVSSFQEEEIMVTYSMGVATNYDSIQRNGIKALEALDLAITRGGSQVVIFDNDKRRYFGGTSAIVKTNNQIKARVMSNAFLNIVKERDVVYLMAHTNPDADCIASMFLLSELINKKTETKVKIILEKQVNQEIEKEIKAIGSKNIVYNYVIDRTKQNLVIVLDTQSPKIVSHPNLIENMDEIIIFDHHQTPDEYIGNTIFSWIEPSSSSTVELIADLLNANNIRLDSKSLANLAILAILTDTNNLKYRVDEHTLTILALLASYGGNIDLAREKQHLSYLDFEKMVKNFNNLELINEKIIMLELEETDDIFLSVCVNEMLEIKEVQAAIILAKIPNNKYKIKIRSTSSINSSMLLEKYGGGGHARQAAGIFSEESKDDLINDIKKIKANKDKK